MYSPILVAIDGGAVSQQGLDEAVSLAKSLSATLHVLHVIDARRLSADESDFTPPKQAMDEWRANGEKLVAAATERARAAGVKVEGAVRDPAHAVCDVILKEVAESGAKLIVMGTHGRRGLKRLTLGSEAEMVVRESTVPVLLVRGQSATT